MNESEAAGSGASETYATRLGGFLEMIANAIQWIMSNVSSSIRSILPVIALVIYTIIGLFDMIKKASVAFCRRLYVYDNREGERRVRAR